MWKNYEVFISIVNKEKKRKKVINIAKTPQWLDAIKIKNQLKREIKQGKYRNLVNFIKEETLIIEIIGRSRNTNEIVRHIYWDYKNFI